MRNIRLLQNIYKKSLVETFSTIWIVSTIVRMSTNWRVFCSSFNNNKIKPLLSSLDHPLSGRPLHTLTINKRAELFFNMGLSLLHAGRPSQAFECLLQSHNVYQSNPRYWLRLAECCMAVHQEV